MCLTSVTQWTVALQVPLSMGFSWQEYSSGLSCSPPGDLPYPGIEPMFLKSPALACRFFTTLSQLNFHISWLHTISFLISLFVNFLSYFKLKKKGYFRFLNFSVSRFMSLIHFIYYYTREYRCISTVFLVCLKTIFIAKINLSFFFSFFFSFDTPLLV